jgi:hypothetical protein
LTKLQLARDAVEEVGAATAGGALVVVVHRALLSCRRMRIRGRARHREPWVGQRRDGAGQRRGLVEPLVVMLP